MPVAETSFQKGEIYTERFLHEVISSRGEEPSSLFTQAIVLSTMLGQCFLLQCQAIATRCEHGGGGAVKGGLLQDTWKDTWKPFYQLIQGILCQLIPKLLSNIELDTAGEGGGVGLFEDMTALVVALSLCVGTSTSSPAPLSNTAALPVISRYERKALSGLATALSLLEVQSTQVCYRTQDSLSLSLTLQSPRLTGGLYSFQTTHLHPLIPVPLFLCLTIARERRGIDALYESVGNRAKAVLQTFAQSKLVALHLYNQTVTEEMSHRGVGWWKSVGGGGGALSSPSSWSSFSTPS